MKMEMSKIDWQPTGTLFFTVLSGVSPNLLQGVYLNMPGIQKSGERGKAAMHITFPARQDFPPDEKKGWNKDSLVSTL